MYTIPEHRISILVKGTEKGQFSDLLGEYNPVINPTFVYIKGTKFDYQSFDTEGKPILKSYIVDDVKHALIDTAIGMEQQCTLYVSEI